LIRAIVVDDERPSLDKLVKLLEKSSMVEVKGKFTKSLEAFEFLKENKVDAVFLDIEMPDMNGIELSSSILDMHEGIAIVFVTAYNQYAVEAFHLNALDYLMKPVSANRLEEALNKIIVEKGIQVSSRGVYFRCFGRFGVSTGSEEVKFRTEKAEELLAYMIDKRGRFISRSEIIDSLWPDFDGDRALIHFNTTLHYVKKALLQYGIQIPFTYDRGGYKFDMEGINCDYLKFCTFIEKAKIPGPENILEFEETAGLFTGEYLSGWEYGWAAIKKLVLEEQYFSLIALTTTKSAFRRTLSTI
jgi:two-component SAPR family response regulator